MKSNPSKVSVHVEVIVAGEHVVSSATGARPCGKRLKTRFRSHPYSIDTPVPGPNHDTLIVAQSDGVNYISACGGSVTACGNYPDSVWALAYSGTHTSAADHPDPTQEPGAVQVDVDNTDGTWAFDGGGSCDAPGDDTSTLVAGAFVDSIVNGDNNSTLIVWYEHDTDSGTTYSTDTVLFHGYIPGDSRPVLRAKSPAHLPALKLAATFHGALAPLGTVHLAFNGVSWVGESSHGGGVVLSLSCHDKAYQLLAAGPGAAFVVAGRATGFRPFQWSAGGMSFGLLTGAFKVSITE